MCKIQKNEKGEICTITGLRVNVMTPAGNYCDKMCGFEAALHGKMVSENWNTQMGPVMTKFLKDEE